MKSFFSAAIMVITLVVSAGCTSISNTNYATAASALNAKALAIQARPMELGMEFSGDTSGIASSTRLFGFLIDGDKAESSLMLMGGVNGSSLQKMAAYRAAKTNNADAFYILRTEEDETGLGFIFRKRIVRVYGKTYKVKELGLMSAERADKLRNARLQAQNKKEKSASLGVDFFVSSTGRISYYSRDKQQ